MDNHLIIIGGQRCGTTYLYQVLDSHPDIYMARPFRPEPKYFLDNDSHVRGYPAYYRKFFSEAGNADWLGEKSTSYIENAGVAERISALIPNAHIIVMLRDPVFRAISNYHFTRMNGLEPLGIEEALANEPERIHAWDKTKISVSPYAYIQRGKYIEYLDPWLNCFGESNVHFLIFENFVGNIQAIEKFFADLKLPLGSRQDCYNERINSTACDQDEVPKHILDSLSAIFRPSNEALVERFKLDLSCWRGMNE